MADEIRISEIEAHLRNKLIPFWKKLRDDEYGGYFGWVGYDLKTDPKSEKGCILNSRITWFFSNAYLLFGDEELLEAAQHGYAFLKEHCIDPEYGGIFWSLNYDGTPLDTTKHTYNMAFAIYALSAYYEASHEEEAMETAMELFRLIESKCVDSVGYLESFARDFEPEDNEKLSENGVMAEKTMNTLLHVLEAYTQLYRMSGHVKVRERLVWILRLIERRIYNPSLHRQEVFFDKNYKSIIDLHSFGHDIEAAWLINRTLEVLDDPELYGCIRPITKDLVRQVYKSAYDGRSFANECENGVVNERRIWWVQAEAVVGFFDAWQKDPSETGYREAAAHIWEFIRDCVSDPREGSEWFWEVDREGKPVEGEPIVEPWKCPYHNGRMCMELIRRSQESM